MALPHLTGEDIISGSLGHFLFFTANFKLCLSVYEIPILGSLGLVSQEDGQKTWV